MYFVPLYARLNALVTHNILKQEISYPVDTGRKLNVHKTFRRRPGYLLNALFTFNLRPVSTDEEERSYTILVSHSISSSMFSVVMIMTFLQASVKVIQKSNQPLPFCY